MSIKPILFNTEMVQAILEGRKTVTRRAVKMNRPRIYKAACAAGRWSETFGDEVPDEVAEWYAKEVAKPPYHPGDVLWVRETWNRYKKRIGKGHTCHIEEFYGYKASPACSEVYNEGWHPSIHMPRKAARLFLRVTAVRVERLRDITPIDCVREGVERTALENAGGAFTRGIFHDIWEGTIKPADLPRYGWDANPWVWVIEFERCDKPENFLKEDADHGN